MLRALGATPIGDNTSNDFAWFSQDLDEFIDVTVAVQLFIRGVNAKFEVTGELASMNSLLGTTYRYILENI